MTNTTHSPGVGYTFPSGADALGAFSAAIQPQDGNDKFAFAVRFTPGSPAGQQCLIGPIWSSWNMFYLDYGNDAVTWDVHDNQRRDWWGNPVVPSWYTDASLVLDLDGNPQPVLARTDDSEMAVTIGADGFSYTRKGDDNAMPEWKQGAYKLGAQL